MDKLAEDALIIGGLALGAYLAYRHFLAPPLSNESGATALQSAGLNVRTQPKTSDYTPVVMASTAHTTYGFLDGEMSQLNFAQRILIGLDKVVPGTFLTDWALS